MGNLPDQYIRESSFLNNSQSIIHIAKLSLKLIMAPFPESFGVRIEKEGVVNIPDFFDVFLNRFPGHQHAPHASNVSCLISLGISISRFLLVREAIVCPVSTLAKVLQHFRVSQDRVFPRQTSAEIPKRES